MTIPRSVRMSLYGFILATGICQTVIASYLAAYSWRDQKDLDYARHYLPYFSVVAAVLGMMSWIWTSVLLSYNNKPLSSRRLAFVLPHVISFLIMAVLWLAVGIMFLTDLRYSCTSGVGSEGLFQAWCGLGATVGALALLLCLLSTGTTFSVYWVAKKSGGLHCKLLAQDGDLIYLHKTQVGPMPSATKVRTTLYSVILVFGLAQNILACFATVFSNFVAGDRIPSVVFGSLATLTSLLTWILASVLLSYNRRPFITRNLTKASTHFGVYTALSLLWLAIMIMFLTQVRVNCGAINDLNPCPTYIPATAMSFVLCILLGVTAAYIYMRTKKCGGTLSSSNVAEFDGEKYGDMELHGAQQSNA
ncbi:hypothetical protein Moror_16421 [Moniliophthora roreri MCA 2997]|uniref:MARVEL domain-containing protein n=2 Tax=Moniliophthora roreri TaxID=221103 RepID=V2XEI0_MONRO|nr:hypothetical protein Moror_16421 [Moniliophthora roreri MCA 2997]